MSVQDPVRSGHDAGMRRVAVAAVAATTAEWLDFFIYTTAAALVLGKLFFPGGSEATGTIAAFGTLAVGFLARPLGGIIAGHLGDRWGRRPTLVLAMMVMGVATMLIGLLPTYAMIGAAAPALLVFFRCLQGLGVGAQWGGGALLLTEHAPVERRGFYGSLVQLGAILGSALANGIFWLLTLALPSDAFEAWGWRIPFIGGFVVVLIGLYIQRQIEDTPVFRHMRDSRQTGVSPAKRPVVEVLRHHWKPVLQATGAFLVVNSSFYILSTGMVDYGTRVLEMPRSTVLALVMGAGLTQVISIPFFGALSDRVKRRPLFLIGSVCMALWVWPLFWLADSATPWLMAVGLFVAYTIHSMMYGPQAAMYAEMFAAEVRFSGASLGYQIASVFAGGLAPVVMASLLAATGGSWSVSGYITVMAALTFVSVYSITEVFRRDLYATTASDRAAQPETVRA